MPEGAVQVLVERGVGFVLWSQPRHCSSQGLGQAHMEMIAIMRFHSTRTVMGRMGL